jgi:hypothetical protein
MRWTKVIEEKRNWEVCYRGGRSYIYSVINHQTGEHFSPFRRLDRAKAFAENPNPVLLHLLGV